MNLFSYIQEQESGFQNPIFLEEGWSWSFKDHIRRSFLFKNTQFTKDNEKRKNRPFKNIIRPILNIHYRTEGFDVKDIEIYVNNPKNYHKSFLIKKFHDKWALKNEMDTFIDEVVMSYVDYGGVLVKNVKGVRPEVVDLRTIAFCDQTDILSGPFAIKHYYSPSQLKDMAKVGWGNPDKGATMSLDVLISKAEAKKQQDKAIGASKTPGKYIEVYEVHNCSPVDYDYASNDNAKKIHIVAFYTDETGQEFGVTLFENEEPVLPFKFLKRDPVQGRALGYGAIEELFEPQVWVNFTEIHQLAMLRHASKILYHTNDPKLKNQNLDNMEMGAVLDLSGKSTIGQIDNQPRNLPQYENVENRWEEHGRTLGAASDIFLGKQPAAGTPFASVQEQVKQATDLHTYRQGIIAVFIDGIYRDWIIPQLAREISKGAEFLSELSTDEMEFVARQLVDNLANTFVIESVLSGTLPTPQDLDIYKQKAVEQFRKGGNKKFFTILKGELGDDKLDVSTNIAGKQKNLALLTDKMVNFVRQIIATPQIRQDPEMVKLVNLILEDSGISPVQFSPQLQVASPPSAKAGGGTVEPLGTFGKVTQQAAAQ